LGLTSGFLGGIGLSIEYLCKQDEKLKNRNNQLTGFELFTTSILVGGTSGIILYPLVLPTIIGRPLYSSFKKILCDNKSIDYSKINIKTFLDDRKNNKPK